MTAQPDADLDLRLVRSFVTVAEHRHFGRAAAVLHVTQPSLSRQIAKLEHDVGVRLLDRTPQGTAPTEAGEAFLPAAKALLRSAGQAVGRARAAARPSRIVVGYTTGIIVTPAVLDMRRRHPEADVVSQHLGWGESRPALFGHRADAVVTRLPFATDGLHVTVLYDEPRVLVVPRHHRLAGRSSVTLADIPDEPLVRVAGADPAWSAFWRIDPRPDGRRAPDGPLVDAIEDKFEVIAAGQAVAIAAGRYAGLRPDLTTVPLEGVEPSHVVVATRADDRGRLVAAFRRCAQSALIGPPED